MVCVVNCSGININVLNEINVGNFVNFELE